MIPSTLFVCWIIIELYPEHHKRLSCKDSGFYFSQMNIVYLFVLKQVIIFTELELQIVYSPAASASNQIFCLSTKATLRQASLVAQSVKNLPAIQESWVQSLGQEDPLEKGMATNTSNFAWRIPWTE